MFGDHSTINTFYDVDEELGSREEYRILNFFGRRALSTEPQNCSFGDFFTEMNLNACCTCSTTIFPRSANRIIDLWRCRRCCRSRFLKCHYNKNHIFSIEAILKHKQVASMRSKMLLIIFKSLFVPEIFKFLKYAN